jgi:hypothetical protein
MKTYHKAIIYYSVQRISKNGKNLIQQTYGRQDELHDVCFLKEKMGEIFFWKRDNRMILKDPEFQYASEQSLQ